MFIQPDKWTKNAAGASADGRFHGILYPFASHLLFGMIGGLLGALIVLGIHRFSQKSS